MWDASMLIAAEYSIPIAPWLPLAVGGVVLLVLALLALGYVVVRRGGDHDPDAGLAEDLAGFRPAPPPGSHRLIFEGLPARLRLVVIAPAGRNLEFVPEMAEGLLQAVVHGLGEVADLDKPRVRVWPGQLSQEGFAPKFFRNVCRPERRGQASRWILVAGPARAGQKTVLVGLALETTDVTMRGNVRIKAEQWYDKFRINAAGDPRP
jgi:hypothetical protein